TRSPQTTGALTPAPVSGTFQRTFSVALQRTGSSFSALTPSPIGPRQPGQLSAAPASGSSRPRKSASQQDCLQKRPLMVTPGRSFLAEQQVHDPAAADVRAWAVQVAQDVGVGAAGVFQGVGQDRQAVEG